MIIPTCSTYGAHEIKLGKWHKARLTVPVYIFHDAMCTHKENTESTTMATAAVDRMRSKQHDDNNNNRK